MKKSERILVVVVLVIVGSAIFFAAFMASQALPVQDFAQYWAAAHLVKINPYSLELTRHFERGEGINAASLLIKNPPWAIMLVLPLSFLGYHSAFAVWSLLNVLLIGACAYLVGRTSFPMPSLAPATLSFIFGPTFVLLMLGQFTALVLAGCVFFCFLIRKRHDWAAGLVLLLVFGKPHVALLFLITIVLWAVCEKRWKVLTSSFISLGSASLLAILIDHNIFEQFRERSVLVVHETEFYPNIGGILYALFGRQIVALLPQIVGVLWVLFYWRKHYHDWVWERHGMIVLLVSVTCSYYSYPYDQVLALPALIGAFATGNRRWFLLAFVLTNVGYVVYMSNIAGRFGFGYMFLCWTELGWLAACILANLKPERMKILERA